MYTHAARDRKTGEEKTSFFPRKNRTERNAKRFNLKCWKTLRGSRNAFSYLIFSSPRSVTLYGAKKSPPVNSSFRKHILFIRAILPLREKRTPFQFTWQILADSRRLSVLNVHMNCLWHSMIERERKRKETETEREKNDRCETNEKTEGKIYHAAWSFFLWNASLSDFGFGNIEEIFWLCYYFSLFLLSLIA